MQKKNFYKWGLILAVFYFLAKILFWGSGSFYSRYVSSQRLETLHETKIELEKENYELKENLDDVKGDGVELEKMAREEYGMQKEGEVMIKFIQEDDHDE